MLMNSVSRFRMRRSCVAWSLLSLKENIIASVAQLARSNRLRRSVRSLMAVLPRMEFGSSLSLLMSALNF
jgi:hypothetical protein